MRTPFHRQPASRWCRRSLAADSAECSTAPAAPAVFVHYWFSFFQKILEEQAPQVAQKNINLKILSDLDVIVPPYNLQADFSDFVRQAEKSKLTIQQSIDKLDVLKKALMQQYFG